MNAAGFDRAGLHAASGVWPERPGPPGQERGA